MSLYKNGSKWRPLDLLQNDHLTGTEVDSSSGTVFISSYTPGSNANIQAYNSSGDSLWSFQFGEANSDTSAESVSPDSDGGVFVTGTQGPPVQGGTKSNAYALHLNATGAVQWQRTVGNTTGADIATSTAADTESKLVYITGSTTGVMGPDAGAPNSTVNSGLTDVFLSCLSGTDGSIQWTRQFGTKGFDVAARVALGRRGGVYVAGQLGTGSSPDSNESGSPQAFIGRWDYRGDRQFLVQLNSTKEHKVTALTIGKDDSSGEGAVYLAGHVGGT